jgi:hypothetical protein
MTKQESRKKNLYSISQRLKKGQQLVEEALLDPNAPKFSLRDCQHQNL